MIIQLINFKLKTRCAINDFKDRIAHNVLGLYGECSLCGEKMDIIHLLKQCAVVKSWELKLGFNFERKERVHKSFVSTKKNLILQMNSWWITNWAIWKTYCKVHHEEITLEEAHWDFKNNIINEEHRFLLGRKNNKLNINEQINFFKYKSSINNQICMKKTI